jgi:hypothetical protein
VKRDADEIKEQFRSRLTKHGELKLRQGSGSWLITLSTIIDFYTFKDQLQEVVDDLNSIGVDEWDHRNTVMKFNSQSFLLRHGVQTIRRIYGYEDNRVVIFPSADFGVVIEDSNIAIPWLEGVQYRAKYVSPIERLSSNNTSQQHLFIFVDSNTPQEIALAAQFHPTALPSEKFQLSPQLTHIWLAPFFNFTNNRDFAWLYSRACGWELIPIDRENLANS